jgi:hypothetical protein
MLQRVQVVREDKGSTESVGGYTFFCGNGNENHNFERVFFVHKAVTSAFWRVEFNSGRKSYIVVRYRWCGIIFLNVHDPTEYKTNDKKGELLWGTRERIRSVS